jgi:hypothetical protein
MNLQITKTEAELIVTAHIHLLASDSLRSLTAVVHLPRRDMLLSEIEALVVAGISRRDLQLQEAYKSLGDPAKESNPK